jgi:P-type Cu+ transporter
VRGAKEQGIVLDAVKDFRSVTAGGVLGTIAGRTVMIGKPDFLRNERITGVEPLEASATRLQEDGKTAMFVAIDGKPAGILAVADPIKSTTAEAIGELHALGLQLVMLTGDNPRTADAVAKQLGLDGVEAESNLPEKSPISRCYARKANMSRWPATASTTHPRCAETPSRRSRRRAGYP